MKKSKVLITGAAGYIGSHLTMNLEKSYQVIAIDDLSNGNLKRISPKSIFYRGSITSKKLINEIFSSHQIETVFHLAALKNVNESMRTPRKYFEVNLSGTQNIVSAMKEFNCQKIVFSSTAAVYGNRKDEMYSEEMDCQPLNPYGESKLKAEILLEETKGLQAIILRYFNVVGGQSEILYDRSSENLFNNILFSISTNRNMKIYGKDLPTRDGTCIRDFINVADIVSAHVEAQKYLYSHQHSKPLILNVGTGVGHTILEIVKLFELYSKKVIQKEMCDARKGDPIKAVAAPFLASTLIDFRAKKNIEQSIMESLSNY